MIFEVYALWICAYAFPCLHCLKGICQLGTEIRPLEIAKCSYLIHVVAVHGTFRGVTINSCIREGMYGNLNLVAGIPGE